MVSGLRRRGLLGLVAGGAAAAAGCGSLLSSPALAEQWTADLPRAEDGARIAHAHEHVYVGTTDGLFVYDATSGEEVGRNDGELDPVLSTPVAGDDRVFYGTTRESRLYAVDETGEELWERSPAGGVIGCAVQNGSVYVSTGMSEQSGLYAFDTEGIELWSVELDDHPARSAPAVHDGRVFLQAGDLTAFDAESGDLDWQNDEVEFEDESPQFAPVCRPGVAGSRVCFTHPGASELSVTDAQTGEITWEIDRREGFCPPAVVDGVAYVATTSGWGEETAPCYAFDLETREELWRTEVGGSSLYGAAVAGDTIHVDGTVPGEGHALYGLDRESGDVQWKQSCDESVSGPRVAGDWLFFVRDGGTLVGAKR